MESGISEALETGRAWQSQSQRKIKEGKQGKQARASAGSPSSDHHCSLRLPTGVHPLRSAASRSPTAGRERLYCGPSVKV